MTPSDPMNGLVEEFLQHAEKVYAERGSLIFCSGKTLRPTDLRQAITSLTDELERVRWMKDDHERLSRENYTLRTQNEQTVRTYHAELVAAEAALAASERRVRELTEALTEIRDNPWGGNLYISHVKELARAVLNPTDRDDCSDSAPQPAQGKP